MPKIVPSSELTLGVRATGVSLPSWLYEELRRAILAGRLRRGTRLPASRELAKQQGVSRGSVVTAFEQLLAEGYLSSKVGAGTFVSGSLPEDMARTPEPATRRPTLLRDASPIRPFRPYEPGLNAFPMELWARVASRRLRKASLSLLGSGDPSGYAPLREAAADYLGRSRGVICSADQVVIVAGTNQSLDLVARLLIQPGDPVWIEDPGYVGTVDVLRAAKARLVPVAVDAHGLDPAVGHRLAPRAKAVYLTPAHQFPLGMTMPLERRLAVLEWARRSGAHILEDDYDSEFRYSGRPVPALQGLDPQGSVIYMGSFNKVLFTSLRLGYMVVPDRLIDPLRALRSSLDRFSPTLEQATLCDFIAEGHFSRHLGRMREIYAERLLVLREAIGKHLAGAVELPPIEAGLHIPAHLLNGANSLALEQRLNEAGVETMAVERFALRRKDINALLLGFAAFEPRAIRKGVEQMAKCFG
jgi:GntR family transcriptional regulator/MocR family aminotransferase